MLEEVGLKINVDKTKYMLLSHHQNVGQNWDIKIANRSFENVSQFKYLGMTVTNQNLIQEEIKRTLNYDNACYHSVQVLLSSHLLSTIILPVVLYGCKNWSLTLREDYRVRVFENMVLRRIFGVKRDEVTGGLRKLHNKEFHDMYSLSNIIRMIKSRRMRGSEHIARMGEKRGAHTDYSDHTAPHTCIERQRCRWVDIIKMDLEGIGWGGVDWIGLAQDRAKVESSSECGNKPSGSMKCWETIGWLHNWWNLE
jgi:hypothetical protein